MSRFTWILFCIAISSFATPRHLHADDAGASTLFHPPVRLCADGKPVDTGESWGHSGPALADVDGDGLRDLVVGDFSGRFRVYPNIGSRGEPAYGPVKYLVAGGVEAKVPIYCCIGSSPHFVDFDADGKLDLVSGSYDPGECYLFRGMGDGKFNSRETIFDKSGKPVLRRPDLKQTWASFGSWPVMVDWDGDGDLDLLVGTFEGTLFVRLNVGTPRRPVFLAKNITVEADGRELKVPGDPSGHAAPAVGDWDGDGRWDLLCGSEQGSVTFYRNVGTADAPRFLAGVEIVPPHQGTGANELLDADAVPVPGVRGQISVVDYNEDGKLDVLLGDFCTTFTPRSDLMTDERAEMFAIHERHKDAAAGIRRAIAGLRDDFSRRFPGDAVYSDDADIAWEKEFKALRQTKSFAACERSSKSSIAALGKYLVKPDKKGNIYDDATCHGHVWLFLRK